MKYDKIDMELAEIIQKFVSDHQKMIKSVIEITGYDTEESRQKAVYFVCCAVATAVSISNIKNEREDALMDLEISSDIIRKKFDEIKLTFGNFKDLTPVIH